MARNKTPKQLVKDVTSTPGWRSRDTKSGWFLIPPDPTKPLVAIHKTPSDTRWHPNALRDLRRSGWTPRR